WVTPVGPGKWMLDLWKANEDQLRAAGVAPSRIENPRLCTACRLDLFFSYRREGKGGSLATVAAVPPSS
ncbi:MAG: laccase domain-containing protein, partial [Candidatus Rokubacteria bacterium]|nr:laccase domain-containing protein [Candidatus Rokubacteria bacterium]